MTRNDVEETTPVAEDVTEEEEHEQAPPEQASREVRQPSYLWERILWPVVVPVAAVVIIGFLALNLSRLFLAAGGSQAVLVASLLGILVIVGAAWATSREQVSRSAILSGMAVLGLAVLTTGMIANEVDEEHLAVHAGDGEGAEVVASVEVVGVDIDFPQGQIEAPAGLVEFTLDNQGATLHTFVFEGFEDQFKLEAAGGASDAGAFELDPGDYSFYCDVPGHRAAGMEGVLTAVEGGGAAPGGEVDATVTALDIDFPQDSYEASAEGGVTFDYVNEGATLHTLVVEGREEDMKLEVASTGDTDQGTIDLDPGTYTIYCDVPGHRAAGMEATVTVT